MQNKERAREEEEEKKNWQKALRNGIIIRTDMRMSRIFSLMLRHIDIRLILSRLYSK